jgi:hypothetical protein
MALHTTLTARASLAGVTGVEPALDAFGQARPSRTRLDPPCGSPGKIDRTAKPFGASAKSNCDLQRWRSAAHPGNSRHSGPFRPMRTRPGGVPVPASPIIAPATRYGDVCGAFCYGWDRPTRYGFDPPAGHRGRPAGPPCVSQALAVSGAPPAIKTHGRPTLWPRPALPRPRGFAPRAAPARILHLRPFVEKAASGPPVTWKPATCGGATQKEAYLL